MEALPDDESIDEELIKFRLKYSSDNLLKELDSSDFKEKVSAAANEKSLKIEANSSMTSADDNRVAARGTARGTARGRIARGRGRGGGPVTSNSDTTTHSTDTTTVSCFYKFR